MRRDDGGMFWDTIFDVVSLGLSIADVIANPSDAWAWVGLAGDVVDLIPFVSGVGEATDLVRVATKADDIVDAIDDVHDTAKAIDNVYDAGKAADNLHDTAKAAEKAKTSVKASERAGAIRKAWKLEYANVASGGRGISRTWSKCEIDELLTTGKVKGYQGHHMKSVKGYPELAGDPHNIQFLTRSQHLRAHGGNFRNITNGRFRIGD